MIPMQDTLFISAGSEPVAATIELPASKSILNRYIIMYALQNGQTPAINLKYEPDDVGLMFEIVERILESNTDNDNIVELFCDNAGTVARMASMLAAFRGGKFLLTGNQRIFERPVHELADILKQAGILAEFSEGRNGFLPLIIDSKGFGEYSFNVSTRNSSQHLSGLLLVGPFCPEGIEVNLTETQSSWPYVELSINMMRNAGAQVEFFNNTIKVFPGGYPNLEPVFEADWSSAAFFLQAAALMPDESSIFLKNLKFTGMQGDEYAAELFQKLGVCMYYNPDGLAFARDEEEMCSSVEACFSNHPDLFNSWAITVAMLNIEAEITGIENLAYKESDRLGLLISNLRANDFNITYKSGILRLKPRNSWPEKPLVFDSSGDHRLAMSFAMAGIKHPVILHNPYVVPKSFPDFFGQLNKIVSLKECL